MEQILEYIIYIAKQYGVQMLIMVALIEVILFLIKKPIKLLTKKIKNDRVRKLANKVFILLTFVLAYIIQLLGGLWVPKYIDINGLGFIISGSFSVILYALGDGVIVNSKPSQIAQSAEKLVTEVESISDKKVVTKKDVQSAINAFEDLCNKSNSSK